MHYLVAENFDLGPFEGFAFDFSAYEDIRELYMLSDMLITDYSSVFFDYANLKRQCFSLYLILKLTEISCVVSILTLKKKLLVH